MIHIKIADLLETKWTLLSLFGVAPFSMNFAGFCRSDPNNLTLRSLVSWNKAILSRDDR